MNKKIGDIIRLVLGCYLAFLGIRILMQAVEQEPTNKTFLTLAASVFVIVGAVYALYSLKNILGITFEKRSRPDKKKTESMESNEDGKASKRPSSSSKGRKGHVKLQSVGPASENKAETGEETEKIQPEKSEKEDLENENAAKDSPAEIGGTENSGEDTVKQMEEGAASEDRQEDSAGTAEEENRESPVEEIMKKPEDNRTETAQDEVHGDSEQENDSEQEKTKSEESTEQETEHRENDYEER